MQPVVKWVARFDSTTEVFKFINTVFPCREKALLYGDCALPFPEENGWTLWMLPNNDCFAIFISIDKGFSEITYYEVKYELPLRTPLSPKTLSFLR